MNVIKKGLFNSYHLSAMLFFAMLLMLSGCTSLLTPSVKTELTTLKGGQYRIDPTHASLIFKVQHLGLSTYVGRFNTVDATLEFDPKNLLATQLSAVVDVRSVDVNNNTLEETLQSSIWFNTEEFPQATFKTLSVKTLSDNSFEFTGTLTFLGVSKPVLLNATFNGGANNMLTGKYTLGFSANAQIKRSEFGMDSYLGLVGDNVKLEIYAEFLRQ